jgi:hypothetical protein
MRNPQVDPALEAVVLTALAKDPAQRYQSAVELQDALGRVLAGDAVPAVATEPLLAPLGRAGTGATPRATGPAAGGDGRGPGWPRWALLAAGTALGIALVVALWPGGGDSPARLPEAGSGVSPATSAPSSTTPASTARPAPAAPGVPAALANLRAVITAARQQGTADQQAEVLLDQAADLANALEAGRKGNRGHNKDDGKGKGQGQQAAKKLAELQGTVEELIGQGKIRPPATTQIQQAVAQLGQAVQQPS